MVHPVRWSPDCVTATPSYARAYARAGWAHWSWLNDGGPVCWAPLAPRVHLCLEGLWSHLHCWHCPGCISGIVCFDLHIGFRWFSHGTWHVASSGHFVLVCSCNSWLMTYWWHFKIFQVTNLLRPIRPRLWGVGWSFCLTFGHRAIWILQSSWVWHRFEDLYWVWTF